MPRRPVFRLGAFTLETDGNVQGRDVRGGLPGGRGGCLTFRRMVIPVGFPAGRGLVKITLRKIS